MPPWSNQVDKVLATIRHMESGDNYTIYNAGGGAAGAYQYIQSTWTTQANAAGYGAYANAPASAAPPNVQDAVAAFNVQQILRQYHTVAAVPVIWYYPAALGNPSLMDSVPYPSAGNTLTVSDYQNNWLSYYRSLGGSVSGRLRVSNSPSMRTRPGGEAPGSGGGSGGDGSGWDAAFAASQAAGDTVPPIDQGAQTISFLDHLPGWGLVKGFFGGSGSAYAPSLGAIPDPSNLVGNFVTGATSIVDLVKAVVWLLNPINILRMVEFLAGFTLMGFGLWAAAQHRGEQAEGFQTSESAISRSGLGRVSRELALNFTPEGKAVKRVSRVKGAPHRTRRQALRLRYEREQQVSKRRDAARRAA